MSTTTAAHTPGPWKVKAAEFMGGGVVAYEIIMPRAEICQQNANLISAAPELLEALEGVLRVADRKTKEFDAARAAIQKAKGL